MSDFAIPHILMVKVHTSGLYRTDLSIDDPGQPWIMNLAACLCNRSGTITNIMAHTIKADGRTTKEKAAEVHGLSPQIADKIGIAEGRVLGCLTEMLKTATVRGMKVVSFGDFDPKVISSVLARFAVALGRGASHHDRLWLARPGTQFVDIQKPYCQMLCKLPSEFEGAEFRWPSLDEAAATLLGTTPQEGRRDALTDILTIKNLYFELARRGYVERAEEPGETGRAS